ncbi:V-type ATPase subunit [Nitzschia inconspicua]|uniref:V-type proton ATPase subunit a n=1 Tax=Nitzschia inconspicua TaxID=303405 RepID=A0A9K3PCJ9_9STRA|nr:V-type ATPase subunit [Nitzschia inconspicua]
MDDSASVDMMLTENAQELVDSRTVLLKNQDTRYRLCLKMSHHINRWTWIVLREKSIYHSLNMFKADVSGMLRGEGWVVAENLHEVRDAVERAHSNMDSGMPSHLDRVPQPWPTPPTYFVTNKFTYAFQEFVNTYGIPRYREANPALFTAATFPFLFGVMYGDIGHGMFLFLNGLSLIWNEKKMENVKMDELSEGLHVARKQTHVPIYHHDEDAPLYADGHDDDDEEHGFGEIVIHQAIETIEFVLGMVSNTASYLRLWALSLAHSELATVFWDKAMLSTLNMNNFLACYFGFAVFAGVTFGVLLMMDVLECFLHALRLHWVEFQNKVIKDAE